jgi:hypothetical protein
LGKHETFIRADHFSTNLAKMTNDKNCWIGSAALLIRPQTTTMPSKRGNQKREFGFLSPTISATGRGLVGSCGYMVFVSILVVSLRKEDKVADFRLHSWVRQNSFVVRKI